MKAPLDQPLLLPGCRPLLADITVSLRAKTFNELCLFSSQLYEVGLEIVRLYYAGNAVVRQFVEYGLPPVYLDLLKRSRCARLHKTLFRFDFFLTPTGPKLVEISSNPWGLLTYQKHVDNHRLTRAEPFPATQIYLDLFRARSVSHIGFWDHCGVYDEVTDLIHILLRANLRANRICAGFLLDGYDGIFYDIEAAYLNEDLPVLLPHTERLIPSPANEIIKRKSFLALMYLVTTDRVAAPLGLSEDDKELIRGFLVPTHLIGDDALRGDQISHGAIKEIVGVWGRQVKVLSPATASSHGSHARASRYKFHRHLRKASEIHNAILQEYISPMTLPNSTDLFTELSVVLGEDRASPFARIYRGTPEVKTNVGLGLVRILR